MFSSMFYAFGVKIFFRRGGGLSNFFLEKHFFIILFCVYAIFNIKKIEILKSAPSLTG